MGESHSLFRIAIFIGFVLLMGSVLATPWVYVGQPLPPNSSWGQFSVGIQNFPVFENPFDEKLEADLRIIADGSIGPSAAVDANGNVPACTNATNPMTDFYGCVVTPDKALSYATANPAGGHQFKVNLSAAGGIAPSLPVLAIRTTVQCEASSDVGIDYLFYKSDDVTLIAEIPTDPVHCINGYANVTAYSVFAGPHATAADYNNGVVKFNAQVSTKISYLRVTLIYGPTVECSSADSLAYIGCILTGFLNTVVRIVRLVFNAVIFLGAVLFWFVGMVGIFFSSLLSILAIPGAPPLVTGFIGILVIGCLFFVAIVFMGKIRGTGNTG